MAAPHPHRRPSSRQPLRRAPFPSRPAVAHSTTRWRSRRVSAAGRQGDRGSSPPTDRALSLCPAVPLKDMKLLDVKVGQLSTWLAMRDFTPSGIVGAFRRGERGGGPREEEALKSPGVGFEQSSVLYVQPGRYVGLKTTDTGVSVVCMSVSKSRVVLK